jgi:hypothetical protein
MWTCPRMSLRLLRVIAFLKRIRRNGLGRFVYFGPDWNLVHGEGAKFTLWAASLLT